MSDSQDLSDLFWSFVTGVIIGWILLGTIRLLWWILKMLWRLLAFVCRGTVSQFQRRKLAKTVASLEQAELLEAEGRVDEAADIYLALARSGTHVGPMALYSLGMIYEQQGLWDDAIGAYRQAVSSGDPEASPLAMLGLADVLYFGKSDLDAAAQTYRQLLRPSSQTNAEMSDRASLTFLAKSNLASTLSELGDLKGSEGLCRSLVGDDQYSLLERLGPTIGLIRVLGRQGQRDEALERLNLCRARDGDAISSLEHHRCGLFRADGWDSVANEVSIERRVS